MSGDLRVIQRGPLDGLPAGIEGIVCEDPDRRGERIVIVRCKACGRGVLARLVREGANVRPDGDLVVSHRDDTCPVYVVEQMASELPNA